MSKKVTTGSFFVAIFVAGIFYLLTKQELFSALLFFTVLSGSFPILNNLSSKIDSSNSSK